MDEKSPGWPVCEMWMDMGEKAWTGTGSAWVLELEVWNWENEHAAPFLPWVPEQESRVESREQVSRHAALSSSPWVLKRESWIWARRVQGSVLHLFRLGCWNR
jgi:hypothetical protein